MTDEELAALEQGSDAWRQARVGSLGASQVQDALARIKSGWGASRANIRALLVAERLTGLPGESYTNAAMQWGVEHETDAREAYAFYGECAVTTIGLARHPTIKGTHASPDGLIADDGLLEVKCPNTATHIETILGGSVPAKYATQCQWQIACTGRSWCDFVSFDPRMPERMRLFVRRLERNDDVVRSLEKDVREFLAEVDEQVTALETRYGK